MLNPLDVREHPEVCSRWRAPGALAAISGCGRTRVRGHLWKSFGSVCGFLGIGILQELGGLQI